MTLDDKIRVGKELFAQKEHCGVDDVDVSFGTSYFAIENEQMMFGERIFGESDCFYLALNLNIKIDGSYNIVFSENYITELGSEEAAYIIFGGLNSPLRVQPEDAYIANMNEFVFFKTMFAYAFDNQNAGLATVGLTYVKFKRK